MKYLSLFNLTNAREYEMETILTTLMELEIFFLFISLLVMFLSIRLLLWTTQYHKNLSWIFVNVCIQYIVSVIARGTLIVLQFRYGGENLVGTIIFEFFQSIRCACIFTCFISIPGLVAERVLATIWAENYETTKRHWIPVLIVILTYSMSLSLTQMIYNEDISLLSASTFAFVLNAIAFIVSLIAYRYAKREFAQGSLILHGVLSCRYQQAENLKSWEILRYLLLIMGIFNVLCVFWITLPYLIEEDCIYWKNVSSAAFDLSALAYGLIAPAVALYFNKLWQKELVSLLTKCGLQFVVNHVSPNERTPSDSCLTALQQQNKYFEQLNKDWNGPASKK